MDGTWTVKQASVTLITYPLGWNMNERQAQNDMTYYSAKNSPDGPAMTWSMFAINEAQLQEQGCAAYTYLQRGSYPYIRAPFFQLSEQVSDDWHTNQGTHPAFPFLTGYGGIRAPFFQLSEQVSDDWHTNQGTHPAFPFLTGYGGYLQVLTHGFTGFRAQEDAFFMDPMMVPQIPEGIKIKGLKYQGSVFDIKIGLENSTITRKRGSGSVFDIEIGLENSTITRKRGSGASVPGTLSPIIVRIGGKAYKQGDYPLAIGESLTLPTRRPDLNGTVIAGNLAQCRPISSEDKWVPGSIPQAAVDGSNATTWQPLTPQLAFLTIDLGKPCSMSTDII
ncbi:hypothetical protein V491_00511 [Pseudogymnoascus sp. VKM F-3775]|nr:hypothetical protein V491_00511 [Pseudogymnoascus sp. VKM F-3775]